MTKRNFYDRNIEDIGYGMQTLYQVECFNCGKQFEAKRYDASFCSSTCRSQHHRSLQKRDKQLEKTWHEVNELIKLLPMRTSDEKENVVFDELTAMKNRIERVLSLVESR